jgi:2-keto-4-pentenoate hydratase/2-oxohepta-3-ene-1,7-dioic acid hydratase in catechol pathway
MKTITFLNGEKKSSITPSKIVCIGRNYVAHAKELGNAVPSTQIIFLKPNSAISTTLTSSSHSFKTSLADNSTGSAADSTANSAINSVANNSESPSDDSHNNSAQLHHYESELCFLIKNNEISAVAFGLDLTRRATQQRLKEKGLPWERAKVFDGAAVFSHFVSIEPTDIAKLSLSLTINNSLVQQGDVSMMLFKPTDIINEVLSFLSLEDGDIIMTGTPAGVGVINKGDEFKGSVYLNKKHLIKKKWLAI